MWCLELDFLFGRRESSSSFFVFCYSDYSTVCSIWIDILVNL
nr:MAG TPA: hypothetical protein [Caudoviricetes sp.]DAY17386.1 MAG TPA: hypothetical protein [Caudoviricetes sp.]